MKYCCPVFSDDPRLNWDDELTAVRNYRRGIGRNFLHVNDWSERPIDSDAMAFIYSALWALCCPRGTPVRFQIKLFLNALWWHRLESNHPNPPITGAESTDWPVVWWGRHTCHIALSSWQMLQMPVIGLHDDKPMQDYRFITFPFFSHIYILFSSCSLTFSGDTL